MLLKQQVFEYFKNHSFTEYNDKLSGSLLSLFLEYQSEIHNRPVLFLTDDTNHFELLTHDLPNTAVILPEPDTLPSSFLSPHLKIKKHLLTALSAISQKSCSVVVAHPSACFLPFPDTETVENLFKLIHRKMDCQPSVIAEFLFSTGYSRVDIVRSRGEFSHRGNIVDCFPINSDFPVRIEIDFDEVESIKQFDPFSQRSVHIIDSIKLYPVNMFYNNDKNRERLISEFKKLFNKPDLSLSLEEKISLLENCDVEGFDYYFHLGYPSVQSLIDMMNPFKMILAGTSNIFEHIQDFSKKLHENNKESIQSGYLSVELNYFTDSLLSFIQKEDVVHLSNKKNTVYQRHFARLEEAAKILTQSSSKQYTLVGLKYPENKQRISDFMFEYSIPFSETLKDHSVTLCNEHYCTPFSLNNTISFFPENYLFPPKKKKTRKVPFHSPFYSDFSDIKPGDTLVHIEYGICRYVGLREIDTGGIVQEFLELLFSGDSKVLLPVTRLHLLQKYQNALSDNITLSSISSGTFKKQKKRIKKQVEKYAEELLRHYAERKMAKGISFPEDSHWQNEFENDFTYSETEDQIKAIEDIKNDMESSSPMDRLLCGDVGFGKTEVAMRAIFKAVDNGYQTMVLAPTTVLSFQHLKTITERFSNFPVNIEMLSRFVDNKNQKRIVKEFKEGNIDILVGTHRIFSKDIVPKKLGLLVIDEEQKFGVLHKEKLKMLKKNIDVLSLSATPIPRTLNMAVTGLRDISIIESPPKDRLSINTYHIVFEPATIAEAIHHELARGGQIYFVNNWIETIDTLAAKIKTLAPEGTRIKVAHGRMNEKDLENIMLEFFNADIDILVSTTIIENGMDVPTSNTMFINEAHTFGLSQLYQLRGRIGRSDKPAYAYLITPGKHTLTEEARQRIEALEEFSHLGAGFRIAMLDLEIRGAGELLGEKQSGAINTIGFEMYSQILDDAVKKLRKEEIIEEETVLDMGTQGQIPKSYIENASLRLSFYRKLNMAKTHGELNQIQSELTDRFGKFPDSLLLLIEGHKLRITARTIGIISIDFEKNMCRIVPSQKNTFDITSLFTSIHKRTDINMEPSGRLTFLKESQDVMSEFIKNIKTFLDTHKKTGV